MRRQHLYLQTYARHLRLLAALCLLAGILWQLRSRALAAPAAGPILVLSDSRAYTLQEITDLIRKQAKTEIYVDRREAERRVFLSRGIYTVSGLLGALLQATGMMARQVKTAKFLAARDLTLGGKANFPVLPQEDLDQLGKDLRFLAVDAPLADNKAPFGAADFLAQKTFTWQQMSSTQQAFVGQAMEGVNRKAKIRLGTSYLMRVAAFTPSLKPGEPSIVHHAITQQVYYDYRSRLLSRVEFPPR